MGKEAGASESVDDHARLEISELLRAGMSMFKLLQPGGACGQRQFGLHVTVNAACKSGAPMTCASGRAAFAPRSVFVPRSGHRAEIFIFLVVVSCPRFTQGLVFIALDWGIPEWAWWVLPGHRPLAPGTWNWRTRPNHIQVDQFVAPLASVGGGGGRMAHTHAPWQKIINSCSPK